MSIIGSSSILKLGISYSLTGGTGPTGPTGATGATGFGLTGNTGANIVGITLVDRYIVTTFSDGSTYGTPTKIYGKTGPAQYVVDVKNLGTGISLAYGVSGSDILLRPIKFINNSNSTVSINQNANVIEITLNNISSGLTVASSSSTDRNFIKFNSSGAVVRIPNTFGVTYDNTTRSDVQSVKFVNANVFEKVRGIGYTGNTAAVYCQHSITGITCTFNPFAEEYNKIMFGSKTKAYVADFEGNTGTIVVNDYTDDGNVYGFDIILSNTKNPTNLDNRFSSNIKWANNRPPCLSYDGITCDMRVSLFGLQGKWYATAAPISKCLTTLFDPNCSAVAPNKSSFKSSILGACCKSDGSCVQTISSDCSGFFHGAGTTCGATYDSICNKPGVCCRKTVINGVEYISSISDQLTCSDCLGITGAETAFAGNYTTLETTNCSKVFYKTGACCDGKGNCEITSYDECVTTGRFYQGDSTECFNSYGFGVCSSGTGPCCINGTCSDSSYTNCFASNGFYLGSGQTCGTFDCPTKTSCLGFIDNVSLTPGSLYGGGVVVGTYIPGKSLILGCKDLFGVGSPDTLKTGYTFNSELFTSFLDHTAYGITKNCNNNNESYIIIVYPHDIVLDSSGNVKNPETQIYTQDSFIWGNTGSSSWGPLLNSGGGYYDVSIVNKDYRITHLKYAEGYWSTGMTGITQGEEQLLYMNTFPTCAQSTLFGESGSSRVFAKSPYGLHGVWHQSWGLYNTIRAISSINAYTQQVNDPNQNYTWSNFAGFTGNNAFMCVRKISDGITSTSQGITSNNSAVSGWYLPSHDEMAFIAANTLNSYGFNLNQALITNGQPLNGTYWTSTGTFDYKKNEGIYTGSRPTPGSVAVAMTIDINGNIQNYSTVKASRKQKYKVRPIRMIRCDQLTPISQLWNIPSLVIDRNKNINQTITFEQL